MSRVRELIATMLGRPLSPPVNHELKATLPRHERTLKKADRVIEEYRKLDGALLVYVRRR